MTNTDWENNWQEVKLSEDELESIRWNLLANEVSGGNMSLEDAVALRKRTIASGYINDYKNFLQNYREQHGELPPRETRQRWHAENPVDDLVDF